MFDIFLCAACKNTDTYPRSLLIRLPTNPAIVSSQQQAFLSCAEERAPERITSCPTLIQDHISAVETGLPSNRPKFLFQLPRSIKNNDPVSGLSVVWCLVLYLGKTETCCHSNRCRLLCDWYLHCQQPLGLVRQIARKDQPWKWTLKVQTYDSYVISHNPHVAMALNVTVTWKITYVVKFRQRRVHNGSK